MLRATIFDKTKKLSLMKLATNCALNFFKKKETVAQLHLSWFLIESDGSTSIPSNFPVFAVCSHLPFFNHELVGKCCASQPLNGWILGVLNKATFRCVKIQWIPEARHRFNEKWINIDSTELSMSKHHQSNYLWRYSQGDNIPVFWLKNFTG